MNDLEAAKAYQRDFLEDLKARREPYTVAINGVDIVVYPGVFPPVIDSELLASHIHVKSGDRILDLTTGSGVLAVIAGLQGATGIAVDINPTAVENANANFNHYQLQMKAFRSDLFENVPHDTYDYIYVDGPYTEGKITESLEYSFYGARGFLTRLFSEASRFLNPQGKILITFAEWGEVDFLESTAAKNGFLLKVVDKKISSHKRVYRLYEAVLGKGKEKDTIENP